MRLGLVGGTHAEISRLVRAPESLLGEERFRQSSPEAQASGLEAFIDRMVLAGDFNRLRLSDCSNFLDGETREKLGGLVCGTNPEISRPAHARLIVLLDTDRFRRSTPKDQASQLRDFVVKPHIGTMKPEKGTFDGRCAPYVTSKSQEIIDHKFHSESSDARRYWVKIGSQCTEVNIPKELVDTAPVYDIDMIAKSLAVLPEWIREMVNRVNINLKPHPHNKKWPMSTNAHGIIEVFPVDRFRSQHRRVGGLIHECGHILSLREWGGRGDLRWEGWAWAMKSDGIPISNYGQTSMYEDFAEAFVLYVLLEMKGNKSHEAEIRALMPERFRILDRLVEDLWKRRQAAGGDDNRPLERLSGMSSDGGEIAAADRSIREHLP